MAHKENEASKKRLWKGAWPFGLAALLATSLLYVPCFAFVATLGQTARFAVALSFIGCATMVVAGIAAVAVHGLHEVLRRIAGKPDLLGQPLQGVGAGGHVHLGAELLGLTLVVGALELRAGHVHGLPHALQRALRWVESAVLGHAILQIGKDIAVEDAVDVLTLAVDGGNAAVPAAASPPILNRLRRLIEDSVIRGSFLLDRSRNVPAAVRRRPARLRRPAFPLRPLHGEPHLAMMSADDGTGNHRNARTSSQPYHRDW